MLSECCCQPEEKSIPTGPDVENVGMVLVNTGDLLGPQNSGSTKMLKRRNKYSSIITFKTYWPALGEIAAKILLFPKYHIIIISLVSPKLVSFLFFSCCWLRRRRHSLPQSVCLSVCLWVLSVLISFRVKPGQCL